MQVSMRVSATEVGVCGLSGYPDGPCSRGAWFNDNAHAALPGGASPARGTGNRSRPRCARLAQGRATTLITSRGNPHAAGVDRLHRGHGAAGDGGLNRHDRAPRRLRAGWPQAGVRARTADSQVHHPTAS
jgi:hypothetical protein